MISWLQQLMLWHHCATIWHANPYQVLEPPPLFFVMVWLWGKPWLFSTNKWWPHLSTYITIQESKEGRYWLWVLIMAAKHKDFSQTEEANHLQFSHTMEILPLNNLKVSSLCRGSIKWGNQYCFQSLLCFASSFKQRIALCKRMWLVIQ